PQPLPPLLQHLQRPPFLTPPPPDTRRLPVRRLQPRRRPDPTFERRLQLLHPVELGQHPDPELVPQRRGRLHLEQPLDRAENPLPLPLHPKHPLVGQQRLYRRRLQLQRARQEVRRAGEIPTRLPAPRLLDQRLPADVTPLRLLCTQLATPQGGAQEE